ncbi:MAG: helix-turn-helix domain-containing protein [Thermobispora bispora]|nr:helix-turn-helix domain-containing protein [Thermobispora bispora]
MESPRSTDTPREVEQLLYTPREAAGIVRMSAYWLTSKARAKQIPHHRIGRLYRFSMEDLKAIQAMYAQPIQRQQTRKGES